MVTNEQKTIAFFKVGYSFEVGLNDPDSALEWYTKVIGLGLKDALAASTLNNRGHIYLKRKIYPTALADLNRAIAIPVEHADKSLFYHNRALVYGALELHDLELADLQRAVSLASDTALLTWQSAR